MIIDAKTISYLKQSIDIIPVLCAIRLIDILIEFHETRVHRNCDPGRRMIATWLFPRYKNARPVDRLQLGFVNKHRGRPVPPKKVNPVLRHNGQATKKARNPECRNGRALARARLRRCDTFDARLSNKLSTLRHSRRNRTSTYWPRPGKRHRPDERTDTLDMVWDIRRGHTP